MYWTAHTIPGELISEEEYREIQELLRDVAAFDPAKALIHDAAVAQDYFDLNELEAYADLQD